MRMIRPENRHSSQIKSGTGFFEDHARHSPGSVRAPGPEIGVLEGFRQGRRRRQRQVSQRNRHNACAGTAM